MECAGEAASAATPRVPAARARPLLGGRAAAGRQGRGAAAKVRAREPQERDGRHARV